MGSRDTSTPERRKRPTSVEVGRVALLKCPDCLYSVDMSILDEIHDDEAGVLCTCDYCQTNGRCEDAPCCGCCQ
jgi:hypothetical protein